MLSRNVIFIAALFLALIFTYFLIDWEIIIKEIRTKNSCLFNTTHFTPTTSQDAQDTTQQPTDFIKDRVAILTDNQYTPQLVPLLLHFSSVLGPSWPIVFFTSPSLIETHLSPNSPNVSIPFLQAINDRRIQLRTIPDDFNLRSRRGVNLYLSKPWLWNQLAPAVHVLVFQTDAIICANSPNGIDSFLQYDFIGAPMKPYGQQFNGGLSLRNRTALMDVLNAGEDWEAFLKSRPNDKGTGEDGWFSQKVAERGGRVPNFDEATRFALQYKWQIKGGSQRPFGYHKVQKSAPGKMAGIAAWCPEIMLTKKGGLKRRGVLLDEEDFEEEEEEDV